MTLNHSSGIPYMRSPFRSQREALPRSMDGLPPPRRVPLLCVATKGGSPCRPTSRWIPPAMAGSERPARGADS
jgi:hypothetical protein